MILIMFFFLGFIQHVVAIKCYTCDQQGYFCPVPLNLDAGEENNEYDIESFEYASNYICLSDHYIDQKTGVEKIILRGVTKCEELDISNHRRHCCSENNCNKYLPEMKIDPFLYSNHQRHLPSIILILFSIICRCFFLV